MTARYTVDFENRLIEPSPDGKWVKYTDFSQMEMLVDVRAEEMAQKTHQGERQQIEAKAQQVDHLIKKCDAIERELAEVKQEREGAYARHSVMIKEARDRLKLHGHTPMCQSRYEMISPDGASTGRPCNCGLDDWMRESGVAHG